MNNFSAPNSKQLKAQLQQHQIHLEACNLCPQMFGPPIHGLAVTSRVMLIGQAPGFKEIEVLRSLCMDCREEIIFMV